MIYFLKLPQYHFSHSFLQQAFTRKSKNSCRFKKFQEYPSLKVLESAWFVGCSGSQQHVHSNFHDCNFDNKRDIHVKKMYVKMCVFQFSAYLNGNPSVYFLIEYIIR